MTKTKTKTDEQPVLFKGQDQPKEAPKANLPAKAEPAKAKSTAVAKVEPPPSLLSAIFFAVKDPKCDPGKMNALLDVRKRVMEEEAHVAFVQAYIEMQADLPTINADGKIEIEGKAGRKGQSTPYATYKNIQKITKPILRQHKFALMMLPEIPESGIGVIMRGTLSYVCDTQYGKMVHSEECRIAAPLETGGSKNNVQGVGSSLSYTKRYASIALLDIVSDAKEDNDDDGEATSDKGGARKKQAEKNAETAKAEPALVSKTQADAVLKAINDCDVPSELFINRFKVQTVHQLPAAQYEEALQACKDYKAKVESKNAKAK